MVLQIGIKRGFDLVLGLLSLPIVVPVVGILAALVKLESPGPAFFRQERVGRDWKPFRVTKLRTMVVNAENLGAGLYAEHNDPRYTRFGLFLRRTSLDELPQVFNVIAGDMSIVGPRPLPAAIVSEHADEYKVILRTKPGITGLSQVAGRNALPRTERLRLDSYYARYWTIGLDLRILARTAPTVLAGRGQLSFQSREDVER